MQLAVHDEPGRASDSGLRVLTPRAMGLMVTSGVSAVEAFGVKVRSPALFRALDEGRRTYGAQQAPAA